jgi:hypothetical protein
MVVEVGHWVLIICVMLAPRVSFLVISSVWLFELSA